MARFLVYTSPACGHLYPIVDTLLELGQHGHEVHVRTLAAEVASLRAVGLHAETIDPAIEAVSLDDWRGTSPEESLGGVFHTFHARSEHEVPDLQSAITEVKPDLLIVDVTTPGAAAVAEAGTIPWAQWIPFFQHVALEPNTSPELTLIPYTLAPPGLEVLNAPRRRLELEPLVNPVDAWRAPLYLYYTAEPFEAEGLNFPASFRLVGPGLWEPPGEPSNGLEDTDQPLVLVTASSEFQRDDTLVETALRALNSEDVRVVATTAAHDPDSITTAPNATIARWLPHAPLTERAVCVVCHGGMGITQRALAAGTPVCVVPFGRDQFEVANRVTATRSGTQVLPEALTPDTLRAAIKQAITLRAGAQRVAAGFRRAGGAPSAANSLELLLSPGDQRTMLSTETVPTSQESEVSR